MRLINRSPSTRTRFPRTRGGFTLLEILIATTITLLMMISLVKVFKVISDSMKQGRAALQMNNTLRAVTTRLRHDLGHLTVRVDPPSDPSSGGGYFEYFDGSMTDFTAALVSAAANRFGDADDIVMFTSRAGDSWFTGQVPNRVLQVGASTDDTPVVITSQLAEVVVFARPTNTVMPGQPARMFDDFDLNGLPDSYQLHYRALLIRPDLNISTAFSGTLPNVTLAGGAAGYTPTAMAPIFQQCDLSMRRVYSMSSGPGPIVDYVAANSLEDLADPANRFAHFQYPLPGTTSCTMPLLVLDPIPNTVLTAVSSLPFPDPNPDVTGPLLPLRHAYGNFLASEFVLGGMRTGEDILANNVLAFDVKGYDPGVPIIAWAGDDHIYGLGPADPTPGRDGSDDVVLSPNDPGYFQAYLVQPAPVSPLPPMPLPIIVSYGEYVDLMWGLKARNALSTSTPSFAAIPSVSSALSGYTGSLPSPSTSNGLIGSGKAVVFTGGISLLQPTYDTWTSLYESNGTRQGNLALIPPLGTYSGVVDVNAMSRKINGFAATDSMSGVTDAGTDGIDNNGGGGADEPAERETSAPFPTRLRGVKISIRIEDTASRQVKQMSIAQDFASQ